MDLWFTSDIFASAALFLTTTSSLYLFFFLSLRNTQRFGCVHGTMLLWIRLFLSFSPPSKAPTRLLSLYTRKRCDVLQVRTKVQTGYIWMENKVHRCPGHKDQVLLKWRWRCIWYILYGIKSAYIPFTCEPSREMLTPAQVSKKGNVITLQEMKSACTRLKLALNCYNITVFDVCQANNKAFSNSFFLNVFSSKIIATINFEKCKGAGVSAGEITIVMIPSYGEFFFFLLFSTFFASKKVMVTIFSFQPPSKLLSHPHWWNVEPLFFLFLSFAAMLKAFWPTK